jgi:hypothetical protein
MRMVIYFQIFHRIFYSLKNYFCQLLNVYNINDIREAEVHTAEPLAPGPSSFEDKIAIES